MIEHEWQDIMRRDANQCGWCDKTDEIWSVCVLTLNHEGEHQWEARYRLVPCK